MLAVVLALVSAVSFGASDYAPGLGTLASGVLQVTLLAQVTSLTLTLLVVGQSVPVVGGRGRVARLRENLLELANSGQPLIVDLNRITFIDSTGLGALVATARRAGEHGGSLQAVCSQPHTRKLLWMTGVDRRIPLTDTVDKALTHLAEPGDAPG